MSTKRLRRAGITNGSAGLPPTLSLPAVDPMMDLLHDPFEDGVGSDTWPKSALLAAGNLQGQGQSDGGHGGNSFPGASLGGSQPQKFDRR